MGRASNKKTMSREQRIAGPQAHRPPQQSGHGGRSTSSDPGFGAGATGASLEGGEAGPPSAGKIVVQAGNLPCVRTAVTTCWMAALLLPS
jgi:hypothetical protein